MIVARANDWILEVTPTLYDPSKVYAWVSDKARYVIGWGKGSTMTDAVRAALFDAGHHYRADPDIISQLEREFFLSPNKKPW